MLTASCVEIKSYQFNKIYFQLYRYLKDILKSSTNIQAFAVATLSISNVASDSWNACLCCRHDENIISASIYNKHTYTHDNAFMYIHYNTEQCRIHTITSIQWKPNYNLDGACDRQQNSQKTKIFDDLVITGTMKRQFKTNKFYLCMLAVTIRMSVIYYNIRSCMLA